MRTKCKHCGKPAMNKGNGKWAVHCATCRDKKRRSGIAYPEFKKNKCESCNFTALHSCQLDIDHVDGNRRNNSIDNLRTLCANCHRLKTFLERQ